MRILLFPTEAEAIARTEQAGVDMSLAYHAHNDPDGSRYVWGVIVENTETDPRAALEINGIGLDLLTATETAALVDEIPTDWQHDVEP
tara:strand:+ start:734 stop:997 length:264 start_codon:yes stop_codon:yes gene_type:complete